MNGSTIEMLQSQRFPDEMLSAEMLSPWGPMAMTEIVSYPYWNMTYHLGQINFIASVLKGQD